MARGILASFLVVACGLTAARGILAYDNYQAHLFLAAEADALRGASKASGVQLDAEDATNTATEPGQVGGAVGDQTGVETEAVNPHTYVAAIVGGAFAFIASVIIICAATYYVHKWNGEYAQAGKDPHCGLYSCLCCLCCTPFVCCCPIDVTEK